MQRTHRGDQRASAERRHRSVVMDHLHAARTIAASRRVEGRHGSGEFRIVMSENSPTIVPRMLGITPGDS
jgi:hypothetical protein